MTMTPHGKTQNATRSSPSLTPTSTGNENRSPVDLMHSPESSLKTPSYETLDVDALMRDSLDVKIAVENRVRQIETRYDEKFRNIRDELRRVREDEARAAVVLKQTCDAKVAELKLKIEQMEKERREFESVKEKLTEQAKQGYMDLYHDLTQKSKDVADSLRANQKKTEDDLKRANEEIERLRQSVESEKSARLTAESEKKALLDRLRTDQISAERQKRRENEVTKREYEAKLEQAHLNAKEVIDLSREEASHMKAELRRERQKIALLEIRVQEQFEMHCADFERKIREHSMHAIEDALSKNVIEEADEGPDHDEVVDEPVVRDHGSDMFSQAHNNDDGEAAEGRPPKPKSESRKAEKLADADAAVAKLRNFIALQRKKKVGSCSISPAQ